MFWLFLRTMVIFTPAGSSCVSSATVRTPLLAASVISPMWNLGAFCGNFGCTARVMK